jgi:hypothetical protein
MRRAGVLWLTSVIALAACATPNTSTTSKGPAVAKITFSGDPALAGAMTVQDIECQTPTLNGTTINLYGLPHGQPANGLTASLTITSTFFVLRISGGSGQNLQAREFTGTGVANFTAASGANISGSVKDTTPAQVDKGKVGSISAVSGTIDCGNQTRGSSTIRITGSSADGPIDITPTDARVACTSGASGVYVTVNAVTTINGVRAVVFYTIAPDSLQFAEEPVQGTPHFYAAQQLPHGSTQVSSTGARVDGVATETGSNSPTPHTVHLQGSATCGSTGTY